MSSGFDPYHQWLGIDPSEQPADHYRLLGLPKFEADVAHIARAADERMALVRTFQAGKRRDYTQRLLNELAAARVVLIDPASKARYDADLTRYLAQLQDWQPPAIAPIEPNHESQAEALRSQPTAIQPLERATVQRQRRSGRRRADRQLTLLLTAAVLGLIALAAGWSVIRFSVSNRPTSSRPTIVEVKPQPIVPPAELRPVAKQPPPEHILMADSTGAIHFAPDAARLAGDLHVERTEGRDVLAHWNSTDCRAQWSFRAAKPGYFRAELEYATAPNLDDAQLEIRIDDRSKICSLRATGGLDQFVTDEYPIAVSKSGLHTLTVQPRGAIGGDGLVVRSVRLVPIGSTVTP